MKLLLAKQAAFLLAALTATVLMPLSAQVADPAPPPPAATNPDDLRTVVSALEDEFLAQVEAATDLERVYDDYEAKLKGLMAKHPRRAEPYFGMSELLEKCGHERALRIVDEILGTADLPEKVFQFCTEIKNTLQLVGTRIELQMETLDGRALGLGDYRGKVLLIDFWATWCGPCVREIPKLKALYGEHHRMGLEIVGVSFDDDRPKLERFIKAQEIPWAQVHAIGAQRETIAKTLGVTRGYLPIVFLVGRDGRIRHTFNTRFKIEEKIASLMSEP